MLSTIPGATADAVLYAEEQGWLELEGLTAACLSDLDQAPWVPDPIRFQRLRRAAYLARYRETIADHRDLAIAPPSQELEPPTNPGRFKRNG